MTAAEPFQVTVRSMLRDRLLVAAAGVFAEEGWRRLTMAKVADRAGVSRQTVYNELGGKQQLAEQLVLRELGHFLDVVQQRFESETAFVPAVRAAVHGALEAAEQDVLLRTVLESAQSGESDLLPYIFLSQGLVDTATEFLADLVVRHHPEVPLRGRRLTVALESVVRLVLSHVSQPARPPTETADDLAFVIGALLAGVQAGAGAQAGAQGGDLS